VNREGPWPLFFLLRLLSHSGRLCVSRGTGQRRVGQGRGRTGQGAGGAGWPRTRARSRGRPGDAVTPRALTGPFESGFPGASERGSDRRGGVSDLTSLSPEACRPPCDLRCQPVCCRCQPGGVVRSRSVKSALSGIDRDGLSSPVACAVLSALNGIRCSPLAQVVRDAFHGLRRHPG
jgi:hypothetical protein